MTWLNRCIAGLRRLFRKSRHEQEMDDELREYLEIAVEHKKAAGLTRDDAMRAVLVETGSVGSPGSPESNERRLFTSSRSAGWVSVSAGGLPAGRSRCETAPS